jgi:hypothetical protein
MGGDGGSGPEAEESRANSAAEESLEGGVGLFRTPGSLGGVSSVPGEIGGIPLAGWVGEGIVAVPPSVSDVIAQDDEYIAKHETEVDARYDAMTQEQREKAYVHPGIWRRIKMFWTGV